MARCHGFEFPPSGDGTITFVLAEGESHVPLRRVLGHEGSGGLDGQEGVLGGVLQVSVESGGCFRIYEACGDRAGSVGEVA